MMLDPSDDLIRVSQETATPSEITARLPSKEALKSIFTMLVGNPDSILKLFSKPMVIGKEDIDKLDEQICNKLGIHQVEATKTTFDITLSDNTILEFETWRGGSINLAIPQHVTAVSIRWDFLVRLPRYPLPQRHVLTVRIGEGAINIARLMQAAFSRDPDDVDKFALQSSSLYCRVDFINQVLSQELINAVDNWHKGTRQATGLLPNKCRKGWFTDALDLFLRYSVPLWAAVLAVIFLFRSFDPTKLTQPLLLADFRHTVVWLIGSLVLTSVLFLIFQKIAAYATVFVRRHLPKTRFELTNGDTNRLAAEKKKATVTIVKFALGFLAALICNILAAYIFARLFSAY